MACGSCGSCGISNGKSGGCRSNGGCLTGGCNKLNVYNWLPDLTASAEGEVCNVVEVSFKNGSRKGFYRNVNNINCVTGEMVAVEGNTGGYDIGKISLSGELVRLQMRKKRVREGSDFPRILRLAGAYDMEHFMHIKALENEVMIRARVIARELKLDMKIGDVEYQGDGRKATFYYIADERVDFRELIKRYAREFRIKIEMRQIGARQEAGRIGGLGTCGRELCCSTWLTDFKTVTTTVARYQNLAINQAKLSGQCGRLKCCLNYELDTYLDALKAFPKNVDVLYTQKGDARLVKMDIFKQMFWYSLPKSFGIKPLPLERVVEVKEMNKKGKKPENLFDISHLHIFEEEEEDVSFEDGTGELKLSSLEKADAKRREKERRKRRKMNKKNRNRTGKNSNSGNKDKTPPSGNKNTNVPNKPKDKTGKPPQKRSNRRRPPNRRNRKPRNNNNPNDDKKTD